MIIDLFTCSRIILGLNLKFGHYLNYSEFIFGGNFVLVSRGAYIWGRLFGGTYIRDFTVYFRSTFEYAL